MTIVCISDTHGNYLDLPNGDILIHAGDLTKKSTTKELESAREWFSRQNYKSIFLVPGNHDILFQENIKLARRLLGNKVTVLIDQCIEINGIKFYGSPWQPYFYDWAFNIQSLDGRSKIWDKIPLDTNVLITHCPPHGLLDKNIKGQSVGCEALRNRLSKLYELKLHIFGHIHEGYGTEVKDGIQFFNASVCDDHYTLLNKPLTFFLKSD